MTNFATPTPTRPRDWWVSAGLTITAVSALASSFNGLRSLAVLAGWATIMALLLPLTIDAYAMTATRVWLAESTVSARARRFARSNAIGAIGLSLVGNGTDHLLVSGLLPVSWIIVVAVGSVPPAVLGLVSHLAVLRTQTDVLVPAMPSRTTPVPRSSSRRSAQSERAPVSSTRRRVPNAASNRHQTQTELLTTARALDADWRTVHDGRPITRDELRRMLRVSAERASAVLRQLRASSTTTVAAPALPSTQLDNPTEEATST
jgi:Protein of unknown function (DUF2637)